MKRRYYHFICVVLLILLSSTKADWNNDDKWPPDEKGPLPTKTIKNDKDKNLSVIPATTTEINIIYTTIIYKNVSSTSSILLLPTTNIVNMTKPGSGNQQQTGNVDFNDPNSNNSSKSSDQKLEESLKNDQQALRRMIMILSLVGGLGFIAIVATIVIFTRMRARNRKQRKEMNHSNSSSSSSSTFELNADNQPRSGQGVANVTDSTSIMTQSSVLSQHLAVSSSPSLRSNYTTPAIHSFIEPSAPPAVELLEDNITTTPPAVLYLQHRRNNILSMSSQTSTVPFPSAPTAKELDAIDDLTANTNAFHHNCSRCTATTTTTTTTATEHSLLIPSDIIISEDEIPPPAYTPSAPPHYILPFEMNHSSSISHLPARRHSLGS
ncbi:MAG: hypothetical protein EXX96DRAFT_577354 [Benjaminiella poitrasii]|nr:MAG: hypothetical protein EXX96DRAFT_577354 [Benjaminiella poitrasii]